jgi:histidine triad (HIT) family protein
MSTIFTQIIRGEISSYKVFEDDHTCAFLARDSIQPGHTLIVPKIEVDYFVDVPEPYYSAVFSNAKAIAKAIHAATGCRRVGTIIAGWDLPHFHYHLIPMFDYFDLDPKKAKVLSAEEMARVQSKIVKILNRT